MGTSNSTTRTSVPSHITIGQPLSSTFRVLDHTELFENIVLKLSIGDVLCRAQRASKAWRQRIQGSLAIQKRCFLVKESVAEDLLDEALYFQIDGPVPNVWEIHRRSLLHSHGT